MFLVINLSSPQCMVWDLYINWKMFVYKICAGFVNFEVLECDVSTCEVCWGVVCSEIISRNEAPHADCAKQEKEREMLAEWKWGWDRDRYPQTQTRNPARFPVVLCDRTLHPRLFSLQSHVNFRPAMLSCASRLPVLQHGERQLTITESHSENLRRSPCFTSTKKYCFFKGFQLI